MIQPALLVAVLLVGQAEAAPVPSEEIPAADTGAEELAAPDEPVPAPQEEPAPVAPRSPSAEAAPLEVEDLRKPSLGPELASAGAGALVPLVLWTPSLLLCCGSASLFGLVWPVSMGDPTLSSGGDQRLWGTLCCMACPMGCVGWLVAMPTSIVAGLLSALVGSIVGSSVGIVRSGGLLRVMASAAAALAAGIVSTLVGLVIVAGVGFVTWTAVTYFYALTVGGVTRTAAMPAWWFGMNVVVISAALVTLGAIGAALALPPAATVGTYALMRKVTSGLATPE